MCVQRNFSTRAFLGVWVLSNSFSTHMHAYPCACRGLVSEYSCPGLRVFVHGYVYREICIAGVPRSFILVYVICIYMHTGIYIYICSVRIHSYSYIDMYTLYTYSYLRVLHMYIHKYIYICKHIYRSVCSGCIYMCTCIDAYTLYVHIHLEVIHNSGHVLDLDISKFRSSKSPLISTTKTHKLPNGACSIGARRQRALARRYCVPTLKPSAATRNPATFASIQKIPVLTLSLCQSLFFNDP